MSIGDSLSQLASPRQLITAPQVRQNNIERRETNARNRQARQQGRANQRSSSVQTRRRQEISAGQRREQAANSALTRLGISHTIFQGHPLSSFTSIRETSLGGLPANAFTLENGTEFVQSASNAWFVRHPGGDLVPLPQGTTPGDVASVGEAALEGQPVTVVNTRGGQRLVYDENNTLFQATADASQNSPNAEGLVVAGTTLTATAPSAAPAGLNLPSASRLNNVGAAGPAGAIAALTFEGGLNDDGTVRGLFGNPFAGTPIAALAGGLFNPTSTSFTSSATGGTLAYNLGLGAGAFASRLIPTGGGVVIAPDHPGPVSLDEAKEMVFPGGEPANTSPPPIPAGQEAEGGPRVEFPALGGFDLSPPIPPQLGPTTGTMPSLQELAPSMMASWDWWPDPEAVAEDAAAFRERYELPNLGDAAHDALHQVLDIPPTPEGEERIRGIEMGALAGPIPAGSTPEYIEGHRFGQEKSELLRDMGLIRN